MPNTEKKKRFRFQNFSQLIEANRLLPKRVRLDPNEESHIAECYNKWSSMNFSLEFMELRSKLTSKITTLNLLLINEEEVVNILLDKIESYTSLSLATVLDLLQNLVCDIGEDFLPYLERFITVLSGVIERSENDAEMLLNAFNCLAQVLFYLGRHLVKNIHPIIPSIRPLLFHKSKYYIRHFTAQSFGYMLKFSRDFKSLFNQDVLVDLVDGNTSNIYSESIGHSMAWCMKMKESILPIASKIFPIFFEILIERRDEFFINCFGEMFKVLLTNLSFEAYEDLWNIIIDLLIPVETPVESELESRDQLSLLIMELFLKYSQNGQLRKCGKTVVERVKHLFQGNSNKTFIEIAKLLIEKLPESEDIVNMMRDLIVCPDGEEIESRFDLVERFIKNPRLELTLKNSLNNYLSSLVNKAWLTSDPNNVYRLLLCMTKLCLKKYPISEESRWVGYFSQNAVNFNIFFIKCDNESLLETMLDVINGEERDESGEEIFWMITIVLRYFHPGNTDSRILEALQNKLKRILELTFSSEVLLKIHSVLDCIAHLNKIQSQHVQIDINVNKFIDILGQYDYSSTMEPLLLEIISKSITTEKEAEQLSNHKSLFLRKLRSPHHQSRLNSLRILQKMFHSDENIVNKLNICDEIETLFELHETELVKKERTVINLLNGISFTSSLSKFTKEIIVNFLLGAMHVQLSSMWKYLGQTLCSFFVQEKKSPGKDEFENENIIWSNIEEQLQFCGDHLMPDAEIDNEITCSSDFHKQYVIDKFYRSRSANWLQLRLNIIKLLTKIPELAAKKTSFLSPLLISIYSNEFCINKNPKKIREETMVSMLTLYSKFTNISCTHSEKTLRNLYYKCLTSQKPALQSAAFLVLVNYKIPELQHYKTQIIEFLSDNKDELKQVSLSLIQPGHRQVMLPIMLRIIVGKLKSISKSNKKNPLMSYLLELEEHEMGQLMAVLLEGLKITDDKCEIVQPDEDIHAISFKIRKSIENETTPQFVIQAYCKTLQGVCVSLKMILKNLLNKLSNHYLTMILKVILDSYASCNYIKHNLSLDMPISQLKPLRQECSKMVLFYFNKIDSFVWSNELLSEITELMVKPNIEYLVEQNQSSVNITIQLCVLWSEKEEMVPLITPDLYNGFLELLGKAKLNREIVGYQLVNIIYNIMQHAATGKRSSADLQNIIIPQLPVLIQYLGKRIRCMRVKKLSKENMEMTITRKELSMITICVDYIIKSKDIIVEEKIILDMINNMLIFLYRSNALSLSTSGGTEATENNSDEVKEQLEVDFLRAIESLSNIVEASNLLNYFERFLGLFSRLRKRASRKMLSILVFKQWPRMSGILNVSEEFNNLGEVAEKLNSWNETRLEEMDSETISKTIEDMLHSIEKKSVKECITNENKMQCCNLHPNLWMYNLVSQNCLFILSEVTEIGTRQIAQDYLDAIIQSIADCSDNKITQVMLYDNIWPALKYGISSKNESLRYSFIGIIKTVVLNFGNTTRFKDIAQLATSESEKMNFFENMLSLTTAFNSKGLRKLVKFLGKNVVSPQNLKEILLPLVWHRIELVSEKYHVNDKTLLTNAHRESLSSSFEALTSVSKQLPIDLYKKLISEQMTKLEKGFNVELIIKTLIALINGYNSDFDKEDHCFMVDILHELEKHLSKRTYGEIKHKYAQKSNDTNLMNPKDAEWTVRGMALQVPIALAIINTVVKLPKKYIKEIITKVILRICDFLKAKETEIRKEAGTTVFQILEILNSPEFVKEGNVKYLGFFIQTVKNNLNRGFQRHVGLNTCHRVLQRLQEKNIFDRLKIDYSSVKNLSELYLDELFGDMAKEKSERATAEKGIIPEAKKVKAFVGLRLLSNILEKDHLLDFFQILINKAKEYKSQSDLHKFQQIFEGIQGKGGLVKNSRLDHVSLFSLSILLISDHMESLFSSENQVKKVVKINAEETFADLHLYKRSVRLDDNQAPSEVNLRSSSHLIINCGLNLLHGLSKTCKSSKKIDLASMLDPALTHIIKILNNVQYKNILFSGMKCLKEIIQTNPASLSDQVEEISNLLFRIHDKYSSVTDIQDEFGESLSRMVNKTITQFIQRSDVHLNPGQYKVLLLGVHVDSLNNKRQMTSFNLLRAIIENRIKDPRDKHVTVLDDVEVQLVDIINKVLNIALLSNNDKTRTDARATIASYLTHNKPSKDFIEDIAVVAIKSMETLPEDGILSACLIVQNILKHHSQDLDVKGISPFIIGYIIVTILNVSSVKVEEVLTILINQTMDCIDTDQQNELCDMVFEYFSKFPLDDKTLGLAFYVMSTLLKCVKSENREYLSLKFVNICMEKLPLAFEYSKKLTDQLIAAKGEDSDLMGHLEKISEPTLKKQKLGEESDDDDDENDIVLENSNELSNKVSGTIENVNRVLVALSSLIEINDNQTDIAILNETVQLGLKNDIWKLVVEQILRNKNSKLRLYASKNIVYKLLIVEQNYKIDGDLTFVSEEMINATIMSSFNQMKNEQLSLEECNSALLNIVLLWQIVLANFTDEVKLNMCKTMIRSANHIANDELISGNSLKKRCAVLKFLASICLKTKPEDLENLKIERNILWMWMREERQSQDENASNKKKSLKRHHKTINRYCSSEEITDWRNLVVEVGERIKSCFGEDKCKKLSINIQKEKSIQKMKRKIADSALAVSNPGEALRKKIKKTKRKIQ